MFIIYNNDGSIARLNKNDFVMQGSNDVNKIFVAFIGKRPFGWTCGASFNLPNGTKHYVPARYATFEFEGVEYKGWVISLTNYETQYSGILEMTLSLFQGPYNEPTVLYTYLAKITINRTGVPLDGAWDNCITVAQFNSYMAQLATKYGDGLSQIIVDALPEQGSPNIVYWVKDIDENGAVIPNSYTMYMWNGTEYTTIGKVTADLSQYIRQAEKGKPNGVAPLDEKGKLLNSYLYGDLPQVIKGRMNPELTIFTDLNGQVVEGQDNKLYLDVDTNDEYVYNSVKKVYVLQTAQIAQAVNVKYDNNESGLTATNLQASTDELAKNKLNKDALQWTTLPEGAVDKKTFYNKTISTLRTANNKIYMFGTPEETPIKEFFDIWEKPTDFKATHVYIIIESISNTASRDSFKMTIHSSNYGNMYYMVVNGYSSQLVGTSGWISYNLLNADRQNKLAKNDGSYINMTVGNAEGLIDPRGKDIPTQVNQDFSSRVTANGASIEESSPDTKASLLSVKGQTLVKNQLVDGKEGNKTTNGLTFKNKRDGTWTVNGTATADTSYVVQYLNIKNYPQGSKFIIRGCPKDGSVDTYCFRCSQLGILDIDTGAGAYVNWTYNFAFAFVIFIKQGYTADNLVFKPEVISLDKWFNHVNIPTSLSDAYNRGVTTDYIPYTEGKLINSMPTRLTSYGSNICPENFELGEVSFQNGEPIENANAFRTKGFVKCLPNTQYNLKVFGDYARQVISLYFYDNNQNYIQGSSAYEDWNINEPDKLYTSPNNAYYLRAVIRVENMNSVIPTEPKVVVSQNQTLANYEPYAEDIVEIPDVGGLNGVGTAHDEITKDKYIKRFEEVDLGSLLWTKTGEKSILSSYIRNKIKASTGFANIICTKYLVDEATNIYQHTTDRRIGVDYESSILIYDSNINPDTDIDNEGKIAKLNGVMLVYELATPVITKHKLDFDYNAYIGGIEAWTNDGVNPLADFHYYINLRDKLVSLRSANVQEQIDNEQDRRLTDLENVTIVNSTEIGNIEIAMEIMPTREQVMINHKFIGNLHDIDLYNQIINTPNVMDGALFRIDIQNDTPRDAVNRGFPNLEQDSVVYGYFYNGQLDSPMIVITDKGMFKIIDGGELTCEVIDGEDFEIEYREASQHQYNISTPQLAHLIKGLRVWYQYEFQGKKRLQHQDIYFTDKGDADATSYISNGLNIVGFLADTIALEFDTETGVLALRSTGTMPQTFKLVDLKGLR